jgi:hypothetical protein
MSEIRFAFSSERGGTRSFNDLAEAILWAQRQRDAWNREYLQLLNENPNHVIGRVRSAWDRVIESLQADHVKGLPVDLIIDDSDNLIADQSPVFMALKWAWTQLTPKGFLACVTAAVSPGSRIEWADPIQSTAVILYERQLQQIREFLTEESTTHSLTKILEAKARIIGVQDSVSHVEALIAQMADAANHGDSTGRERLAALEAAIGATEFSTNTRLSDISHNIGNISEEAGSPIANLTSSSKEKIDNWFSAFKEQRQLEAPVALWEERATTHENTLKSRKWWMIGVGIIGLIGAGGVALAAFAIAHGIFKDAVIAPQNGRLFSVNGMRASFHFELLLASAGTLLYLTMYLWTMRLLVRLYTTEHHLAIDARGRSALTETYLSLTKEGAATDADRAIMLAVIFRPVADGMVKEDGPPAISPAAMIATLASGSSKAG